MEKKLTNPLEQQHFHEVCKPGQGNACCRYVVAGSKGIECAKHSSLKTILDQRAEAKTMVAQSDNCEGVLEPGF